MLKGKGISKGIAIGKALILKKEKVKIEKNIVENIDKEIEKIDFSVNSLIKETEESIDMLRESSNNDQVKIL